jgi:hypothetical protein
MSCQKRTCVCLNISRPENLELFFPCVSERNKDTRCPKGLPEMLITTDGLAAGKAEELATHFGHSRTSLYSCLMLNSSCATSFSVILPETCTFFSKIIACCDILEQRINCTLQIKDSIYIHTFRSCIFSSGVRHFFPGWPGPLQNEQKIKEHFGHCALLSSSSMQPITQFGQ